MIELQPPPDLRERVMAVVRAQRVPSRGAGVRRQVVAIAGGLSLWAGMSVVMGRPALRGRPMFYVLALSAAWLLVGVAATWAGVGRGRSMLGRAAAWKVIVVTLTPATLLAAALVMGMVWPQTRSEQAGAHAQLVCVLGTIALALGPLAAFTVILRGTDPVVPRLTGAALAVAAGAWGALGIELHCRHTSPWHVTLGHVLPVALLGLLGVVLGNRVVAIRSQNG
jgi:hypothetical protein